MSRLGPPFALIDSTLELIFSPTCWGCGQFQAPLCIDCAKWNLVSGEICEQCGDVMPNSITLCGRCLQKENPELLKVRSLLWLGQVEGEIMRRVKFSGRFELLSLFKEIFDTQFQWTFDDTPALLSVPMPYERWKTRTFNPAEILVGWISKKMPSAQIITGLKKTKNTRPQSSLSRKDRLRNLRNSFEWDTEIECPKKVLLIDDIYTTGSTFEICAKVLRKNGCDQIYAWSLFRTPLYK